MDIKFPSDVAGWLTEEEGRCLATWAEGKRVLEIGSYCGRSTICLAQPAKRVVSVDPHDGRGTPAPGDTFAKFTANLQRYGVFEKVGIHKATIDTVGPALENGERFDLIFIDGAHDYASVTNDIRWAVLLLKPDGLLAFHDYRFGTAQQGFDPGVEQAVNEIVAAGARIMYRAGSVAIVDPGEMDMAKKSQAPPTCGTCKHWHEADPGPEQRLQDAAHGVKRGECRRHPPQYTVMPIGQGRMVNTLSYPVVPNGFAVCGEFKAQVFKP